MSEREFENAFCGAFMSMVSAAIITVAASFDATWWGIASVFIGASVFLAKALSKRVQAIRRGEP